MIYTSSTQWSQNTLNGALSSLLYQVIADWKVTKMQQQVMEDVTISDWRFTEHYIQTEEYPPHFPISSCLLSLAYFCSRGKKKRPLLSSAIVLSQQLRSLTSNSVFIFFQVKEGENKTGCIFNCLSQAHAAAKMKCSLSSSSPPTWEFPALLILALTCKYSNSEPN